MRYIYTKKITPGHISSKEKAEPLFIIPQKQNYQRNVVRLIRDLWTGYIKLTNNRSM